MNGIDWQRVCINLRAYKPLTAIAYELGINYRTLESLSSGRHQEPRINTGLLLLDLHYDHCRDKHTREALLK